ncbi:MAG: isocitrate dehydrogenase (NADP(+)) [Calditrichaceae bacterium]|nr:isocitrate dehydrogenase (NADP(+)) [Calditrichia bacterium]NUQ42740.1 isocitrate dehydrogenase (NADP(+)) [Calditrichaceae bacterium]
MFKHVQIPNWGEPVKVQGNQYSVPDKPIIPFIEGDGIGIDIWPASQMVFDAAVKKAYGGKRQVAWMEIYAGEKAQKLYNEWLPNETIEAIRQYTIAIKGPLTTPVGGGFRSLNVAIRQILNLYACIRPVKYYKGVPSPVRFPEKMNVVVFRENTEDVYAGIEYKKGTPEARKLIDYLIKELGANIALDSGIGIKPISETASKRLIRKGIDYLLKQNRRNITLMHKGNIMKFTEGAFKDWGYELAREEYGDHLVSEEELWSKYDGKVPTGKKVIMDRIADNMLQQILTRTDEYDIIATPNLNGDYISDACAAQVGGLGMAPGANIGDVMGVFEATHGTAPKYAGQDKVNPASLMLSGVLMFQYLGWNEVGSIIEAALEKSILQKRVTYDLARQMEGNVKPLKSSEFARSIIDNF